MSEQEERETFKREVSVDLMAEGDGRTLVARLVPYGEIATVNDGQGPYRERFAPGAFKAQLRAASRIKAFLNFRHRQGIGDQIGHATKIEDRADGLHGELRVLNTPAGDTALELYREGMLDKLSIEFESRNHRVVDGIVERLHARLVGVALVPEGAYTGAGVLSVREETEERVADPLPALDPQLAERLSRFVSVPPDLLMTRSFTEQAWDGSPSRWADVAAYARACVIDDNPAGQAKTKALCHLPIIEPSGDVNVNAVRAALDDLGHVPTSVENKTRARRRLERLLAEFVASQEIRQTA